MNTYPITLRDADEIERFFLEATGMKPGYLQLSRGLADLRIRVVELAGVTLVWTRARGRARWRDQMTGEGLHVGFPIESSGPITVRGREIDSSDAQVWMPDKEMDLILNGPNLTLDIGVEQSLVKEMGWTFAGDPLRKVSEKPLNKLIQNCSRASDIVRSMQISPEQTAEAKIEILRDGILKDLVPVLAPWQSSTKGDDLSATRNYQLVRTADEFFHTVGIQESFEVDMLADWLRVPKRTVFHAFNKLLGVGPRRYLEIKRLHTLRARLRKSSYTSDTVSSLATELGFTDMGRLATIYQHHFGEKPSETLRFG